MQNTFSKSAGEHIWPTWSYVFSWMCSASVGSRRNSNQSRVLGGCLTMAPIRQLFDGVHLWVIRTRLQQCENRCPPRVYCQPWPCVDRVVKCRRHGAPFLTKSLVLPRALMPVYFWRSIRCSDSCEIECRPRKLKEERVSGWATESSLILGPFTDFWLCQWPVPRRVVGHSHNTHSTIARMLS